MIADEDKANLAIKHALDKGPPKIRVLSREELKMEIKKYKNISLKVVKEMQRQGQKVPGYAANLAKEMESGAMEGVKAQKSDASLGDPMDEDSMFEVQSEMPEMDDKVMKKMDALETANINCTVELKEKNAKILEMLAELEEIKIQVFARDKSIELQQK